jgi:hypothetical protein
MLSHVMPPIHTKNKRTLRDFFFNWQKKPKTLITEKACIVRGWCRGDFCLSPHGDLNSSHGCGLDDFCNNADGQHIVS